MQFEDIFDRWYAEYYDSRETQTYDVELMKELLSYKQNQKVLEVCCGTGRILLPLARDGHEMHGIDLGSHMLSRLLQKSDSVDNIHIHKADILNSDWGTGYDTVLLAGNIIINIEGSSNYKADQQRIIQKAYKAIKPGGYLLLDGDGRYHPEEFFKTRDIPITIDISEDSQGVTAKRIFVWSKYNIDTQIWTGKDRFELRTSDGKVYSKEFERLKHIPTVKQMKKWVASTGFDIIHEWGDHYKSRITDKTGRVVIWARKT
jgi:ubiquinone/menaquinone biosynthesis C-methylase UbiE